MSRGSGCSPPRRAREVLAKAFDMKRFNRIRCVDDVDADPPASELEARQSLSRRILALAKRLKADLVVMDTIVRTGIIGFLIGNTAEPILDQAERSVQSIKPVSFETRILLEG